MKTSTSHSFRLVIRSLIKEQYAEIFQNDENAAFRLARVVYDHYEESESNAKTYQEFDHMMRSWLMTQPRIWNRQDINIVLKRVWKLVHRGIQQSQINQQPYELESSVAELSELAKEMMEFYEKNSEDIDSVEDLQNLFEKDTIWAREEGSEQLRSAAEEVWQFVAGVSA